MTTAAAVIEALQRNTVDGIARMSRTDLSRQTRVSERAIGNAIKKMAALGAIEQIRAGSASIPAAYRVLRADVVLTNELWTPERVALITEAYPKQWNGILLSRLNGLPGARMSGTNIKEFARSHDLRKSPELLAQRKAPIAKPRPKAAPVPAPRREAAPVLERGGSTGFTARQSVFSLRGTAKPTMGALPPRQPGECAWALKCDEPATVGNWCARHRAMLRGAG